MRRILIDNARRKQTLKRGGGQQRVDIDNIVLADDKVLAVDDLLALDEALTRLSQTDKIIADLVKLRYFAGLTSEQAAKTLGISHNTADAYWAYARSWLRLEITKGTEETHL